MTLEEKYIKKLNFDLGEIEKDIEINIERDRLSALYYLLVRYESKTSHSCAVLRLYHEGKTNMSTDIEDVTEFDNLVILTFLNIIQKFKSYLNKDPLFFYNYIHEKQIEDFKKLNKKSKINCDLNTLYDLIVKKDSKNEIEFLKRMKPSKSYKLFFLDSYYDTKFSLDKNFQIQPLSLKISLKKEKYYFTFFEDYSLSFSFEHALTLLCYFRINNDFKLFDTINKNIDLIGKNDVVNTQINSYLEKIYLSKQIDNF